MFIITFILSDLQIYPISYATLNPLIASVALIETSKSIDWFLYEGNTGT